MPSSDSHLPILGYLLLYSSIITIRTWTESPVEGILLFIMNTFGLYKTFEQTTLSFGLVISFLMMAVTWYCYRYIHFFTLDLINIGFFYALSLCQIEARYPLTRGNIEYSAWIFVMFGHVTQGTLLHSWLTNQTQQFQASAQAFNALGLASLLVYSFWRLYILYSYYFYHFCYMFYNTYPSSCLEFIVAEITSQSVIILWTDTSSITTQKVTKMLVQVNDLFVGQVDIMDKGIKISELEPKEEYEIRIWCQIENSKFYPARKLRVCTDSYKKVVEDDVISSGTSQVYSEFELQSMRESIQTKDTESIPKKDSRLRAARLQVVSLQNVYNSIQKSYTEKKAEYLNAIHKAKTHFEALNLERPNLLRNLKILEGNKKIILNQKSKLDKELLSGQTKSEMLKQDLLLKNQMKSTLNGDIRIISLNMTDSKRKHLHSMETLNGIKQEYISEIKDLEEALQNRKQYLGRLEERISVIKERISFIKHLLGQLCKFKIKSKSKIETAHAVDALSGVDADDADCGVDRYPKTSVNDHGDEEDAREADTMEAWVDLLTD